VLDGVGGTPLQACTSSGKPKPPVAIVRKKPRRLN
jgi:hypothetical protein